MSCLAQRAAKIGDYRVLRNLGQGAMGVVYKGHCPVRNTPVAIKVVPERILSNPELRLRFAQECRLARKLDHPHIVRVLDFGLDKSRAYLVMEFVEGETLGDRLAHERRLPEAEAVRIIREVGHALHWAHGRRLVHRDVKPDNILLNYAGVAKLADLGLAKDLESTEELTKSMSMFGTVNFMPPEQFEDAKRADALSDQYSLAATLYMAVTGELPFRTRRQAAVAIVYQKKLKDDLPAPRELVPELSEHVDSAIRKALRADRRERFANVLEFLDALVRPAPAKPSRETVASPTAPVQV